MPTFIQELTGDSFNQLKAWLEQDGYVRTPEDVRNVFAVCQAIGQGIDSCWIEINRLLDAGGEGRGLRSLLVQFGDMVRLVASALPQIREKVANESPSFDGKEAGLRALEESASRVQKTHKELEPLLSWLPGSPPRVDPSALTGAGPVPDARGYVSLEEMPEVAAPGDLTM